MNPSTTSTMLMLSLIHIFTARLEDLLDLIGGKRVQAAAERVELDEVQVAPLGGHLGGRVQARVVHPLVHNTDVKAVPIILT